jgi:hypothetical protein
MNSRSALRAEQRSVRIPQRHRIVEQHVAVPDMHRQRLQAQPQQRIVVPPGTRNWSGCQLSGKPACGQ